MTYIEIVREIMSDMISDDVDSITDTEESEQVARIVRSTYYEMIGRRNWPHLKRFSQINAVSDTEKPTHFKLPENIKELLFVHYDTASLSSSDEEYKVMKWIDPDAFLRKTNQNKSSASTSQVVTDYSGARFIIRNDKMPTYYTSFDDKYIVMDSFDSSVNSTLITDKTQCSFYETPVWKMEDDFVPDLPIEAFPGFLAECKSVAFVTLLQVANEKEEQKARRQNSWMSRKAWVANGGIKYPNYGRRRGRNR